MLSNFQIVDTYNRGEASTFKIRKMPLSWTQQRRGVRIAPFALLWDWSARQGPSLPIYSFVLSLLFRVPI